MKFKITLILIVFGALQSSAQKNSIEIGIGGYHFYNVITSHDRLLSTLNLTYQRKIVDKTSIFVSYTRIPFYFNGSNSNMSSNSNYKPITTEEFDTDTNSIGKLHERYNYYYFDLGASYNFLEKKQHVFQIQLGASIANGINTYKTNLVLSFPSPEGWVDIINMEKDFIRETYFGGLLGIRYNYSFYKDKISIGGGATTRIYNKGFPFQMNYGVSVGYNF